MSKSAPTLGPAAPARPATVLPLLGVVLTTVAALSVHVIAFQVLGIPDISGYPTAGPWVLLTEAVLCFAALDAWRRTPDRVRSWRVAAQVALLFVLLTTLRSVLIRNPVMQGVTTGAWTFGFLANVPALLPYLGVAVLVVALAPRTRTVAVRLAAAVLVAIGAFTLFGPWAGRLYAPLLDRLAYLSHPDIYDPPYDWHVLVPAYVTFLEPVLASVALAALVWRRLPAQGIARWAAFAVLLMSVDLQIARPIVYAATSSLPVGQALLSAGQFWVEGIVLAIGAAATWRLTRPWKTDRHAISATRFPTMTSVTADRANDAP